MSEPERLGEILPSVMLDIQRRTRLNHQAKVLSAMQGYEINRRKRRPARAGRSLARPKPAATATWMAQDGQTAGRADYDRGFFDFGVK
jgi:hypothetical protein